MGVAVSRFCLPSNDFAAFYSGVSEKAGEGGKWVGLGHRLGSPLPPGPLGAEMAPVKNPSGE